MSETNSDPIVLHGPFEIDVRVAITDGKSVGEATVTAKRGHYPEPSEIKASVDAVLAELPDGYRAMTKREWFDSIYGMRVAIPGGDEWDQLDDK